MKKKEERMEKQMNEIMAENKRLTEPLQKAREEVEELRKQVSIQKQLRFKLEVQMTCIVLNQLWLCLKTSQNQRLIIHGSSKVPICM